MNSTILLFSVSYVFIYLSFIIHLSSSCVKNIVYNRSLLLHQCPLIFPYFSMVFSSQTLPIAGPFHFFNCFFPSRSLNFRFSSCFLNFFAKRLDKIGQIIKTENQNDKHSRIFSVGFPNAFPLFFCNLKISLPLTVFTFL